MEEDSDEGIVAASNDSYASLITQSWWTIISSIRFTPRFPMDLSTLESRILSHLTHAVHGKYVHVGPDRYIWTLAVNVPEEAAPPSSTTTATPLVLLHGIGAGTALWVLNIDALAADRPVYIIDMLGFGKSSRPTFSDDAVLAEMEMVDSLEAWRKEVGLEKFVLLGHCFGGFIATSYAISYPEHIRHLILVDAWGFLTHTGTDFNYTSMSWYSKVLMLVVLKPLNPFSILRFAGKYGPALVARFKPDLISKYSSLIKDDSIAQYIYEWNAPAPTGETAFKHMTKDFGWARHPMIKRINDIPADISITTVFGSRSFIDSNLGRIIEDERPDSYVDVQIVRGAGHFVFADKPHLFNQIVTKTCAVVDRRLEILLQTVGDNDMKGRRRRLKSESVPNLVSFDLAQQHAKRLRSAILKNSSVCEERVEEDDELSESGASVAEEVEEIRVASFNIEDEEKVDD